MVHLFIWSLFQRVWDYLWWLRRDQ